MLLLCIFLYLLLLICLSCLTIFMRLPSYKYLCMNNGKALALALFIKPYLCVLIGSMLLRPFDIFKEMSIYDYRCFISIIVCALLTFYLDRFVTYLMEKYIFKRKPYKRKIAIFDPIELNRGKYE